MNRKKSSPTTSRHLIFAMLRAVSVTLILAFFLFGMNLLSRTPRKVRANQQRLQSLALSHRVSEAGFANASSGSRTSALPVQSGAVFANHLWQPADNFTTEQRTNQEPLPNAYATMILNREALVEQLRQAPMEFSKTAEKPPVEITLPMPNGRLQRFRIEESPVMEPALAAQYPEIKTYRGQGLDDPTATTRFDWTPLGFNAIILSAQGTSFVEPVSPENPSTYIAYFNQDVSTESLSLSCLNSEADQGDGQSRTPSMLTFSTGSTLRTYRLAVAATGEFTQQYGGGNVNTTLTKITTLVNQINAVYQKEATITFQLIANETSIIYTDGATDPYTNSTPNTMLTENQNNLTSTIGSANYDIGHVFGDITVSPGFISFSGVASLGVVCTSTTKGRGVSTMGGASSSFPHSIFVSGTIHEIAHQFSAPHTFNSTTNGCSGQRSGSSAYEPGSGSTIMGYSICGSDNLQSLPDLYFHTGSLENIVSYAAGAGNCASQSATGNGAPTIAALSNFTIPANTPFTLTASATDPNSDALTYNWEEFDLGAASPPNTDDGTRPIFRSFTPTTNASRTLPRLQYILNNANVPPSSYACGSGTCLTGEVLPSTTRTMNFRTTVRDNRASGGGTANAAMQVSVIATAGPFAVTQPNTSLSWTGGTSQTVTWSVANTTGAPISTANVKISLSTDGGNTFPTVLQASTPNDGSENVFVPNTPTSTARIKVEAVGNIFFDISNANFTIVQGSGTGSHILFDFDGDSKADVAVFRPSTGTWLISNSSNGSTTSVVWGANGDTPVAADYDNDGKTDIAVFRPSNGTWYIQNSSNGSSSVVGWGVATDTPAPADYDGDGKADVAVWRPANGTWYIQKSSNGMLQVVGWGATGDVPVPADYDNDNKADVAVFRPSTATWLISNSSNGSTTSVVWGATGDITVPSKYDNDGKTDIAVFRPSNGTWYIQNSSNGSASVVGWGVATDTPAPADYDGDGKADVAVWRPANGTWYIQKSSNGMLQVVGWGATGDIPISGAP